MHACSSSQHYYGLAVYVILNELICLTSVSFDFKPQRMVVKFILEPGGIILLGVREAVLVMPIPPFFICSFSNY